MSSADMTPTWLVRCDIVRLQTGEITESHTLPLENVLTKVGVVSGGFVLGDVGTLHFYTRVFHEARPPIQYARSSEGSGELSSFLKIPGSIYVASDKKHFAVIHGAMKRENIIFFDGDTFKPLTDLSLRNLFVESFSLGTDGFVFADNQTTSSTVHLGDFNGSIKPWAGPLPTVGRSNCQQPLYVSQTEYVDVCGQVAVVELKTSRILLPPSKKMIISGPGVISPNKTVVAVLGRTEKGGGVFDTDERQTSLALYVVMLNGRGYCRIPLGNPNMGLVSFEFADDESIALLSDKTVSLYSTHCEQ